MKKAILYLCLAAGLMSCAKELDMATVAEEATTVEETPAGVPMTFNLAVTDGPETKAAKTAWAENDVIYVFFKGLGEKYLKLTYNGSSWDNTSGGGTLLDTDFANLGDKTLTAVHYPVPVKVTYVDYEEGTDDIFIIENLASRGATLNYYLSDAGETYSVDGTTVTASLSMAKPAGVALFHIAGLTERVKDYSFSCPLVMPFTCAGVRINGSLWEQTFSEGNDMWGFADADGTVFAGRLMTTEKADYTFTLEGKEGTYTLSRSNRALAAGKMYNFPALDDDDWTVTSNIDYVDLGLPSGTLWATVNIGARTPEEYGDYFAWGETSEKSTFNLDNYRYYDYDNRVYTKYTGRDYSILQEEDDASCHIWGGGCSMPTAENWEELMNHCSLVQTRLGGVEGWQITGNGNSIFLPLGGYYGGSSVHSTQSHGYYWSSSLCDNRASAMIMNPTLDQLRMSDLQRHMGALIRPVKRGNKINHHEYVDMGNGLKWATMNVGATSRNLTGYYFAWGETQQKYSYSKDNYFDKEWTKYNWRGTKTLTLEDDAARASWGGTWRMPTQKEWQWLIDNCTWTLDRYYNRIRVTSNVANYTDRSLFFPLGTGYKSGTELYRGTSNDGFNHHSYYWSSTLTSNHSDWAWHIHMYADTYYYNDPTKGMEDNYRHLGMLIRPVSD